MSNWFKHDSNAASDPRCLALLTVYGTAGYGMYWILLERLREEEGGRLELNGPHSNRVYARLLYCDPEQAKQFIQDCIQDFGLFEADETYFWSKRMCVQLTQIGEKSELGRKAAQARYARCGRNADAVPAYANETREEETRLEDSAESSKPVAESLPAPAGPAQSKKPKQAKKTDPRIKELIDYYHQSFERVREFAPTVNGGTWGAIFRSLLRDSSADTIKAVIDEFFAYEKRTRHGIHDFQRCYDNVYGRLYDQQTRRRR